MYASYEDIRRFSLFGNGEYLGTVHDIYVDQRSWKIAYLVIETGGWFSSKKVLIDTVSLTACNPKHQQLISSLSRTDLEKAPPKETHQPIGRNRKTVWNSLANQLVYAVEASRAALPSVLFEYSDGLQDMFDAKQPKPAPVEDRHLRSANDLKGYSVRNFDDELGDIFDIVFDAVKWELTYLVIDTGDWMPERLFIVAPNRIRYINWLGQRIYLRMTMNQVESGPQLKNLKGLERSFESEHYLHQDYSV